MRGSSLLLGGAPGVVDAAVLAAVDAGVDAADAPPAFATTAAVRCESPCCLACKRCDSGGGAGFAALLLAAALVADDDDGPVVVVDVLTTLAGGVDDG